MIRTTVAQARVQNRREGRISGVLGTCGTLGNWNKNGYWKKDKQMVYKKGGAWESRNVFRCKKRILEWQVRTFTN